MIESCFQENSQPLYLPEHALIYAVLERSFKDVLLIDVDSRREVAIADRIRAIRWIYSQDDSAFSFCWICEHLNIDPGRTRASLEKLRRKKQKRRKKRMVFNNPADLLYKILG